jgi:hypothetical protein
MESLLLLTSDDIRPFNFLVVAMPNVVNSRRLNKHLEALGFIACTNVM